MARTRAVVITRAVLAVLVFFTLGATVASSSLLVIAEDEAALAGEWEFSFDLENQFGFSATPCIGSLVEGEEARWLILGMCDRHSRMEGTAVFDKAAGTVSVAVTYATFEFRGEGTLILGGQACILTEGAGPDPTITFDGCKGRSSRGLVRCPWNPPGPSPIRQLESVDAELVLQFHAALEPTLACLYLGDVNVDGNFDSVDALLILQFVAGAIDRFPPY